MILLLVADDHAAPRLGFVEFLDSQDERVEQAGGRFLLRSHPGGGTDFTFELPLPAARSGAALAEEAAR